MEGWEGGVDDRNQKSTYPEWQRDARADETTQKGRSSIRGESVLSRTVDDPGRGESPLWGVEEGNTKRFACSVLNREIGGNNRASSKLEIDVKPHRFE
ncbi:hypothetical protein CDAR_372941 [Caerostris darwini]|uniref:Uncharacterized protein n=1 Tax=Caerostris darwini TaxID=1538125 RepID=A0AAV4RWH4_9ARAC|nr:hypothetical protein CDAR_372831 [Caerostris darwini]GIY24447.1 hypothetical protein CDAR_372941 [Caerostris darwini]